MTSDEEKEKRDAKRGALAVSMREAIRAAAGELVDEGVQAALFPAMDGEQPAAIATRSTARPGRPVGATNLSPQEYQRYLLTVGGDVGLRATRIAMADTHELAKALLCSPLEALELQRKFADLVLPYQRQKMPQAVELVGDQWAGFMMLMGAADRQGNVDPGMQAKAVDVLAVLSGPAPKGEDLQGFGDVETVNSDSPHSDTASGEGEK